MLSDAETQRTDENKDEPFSNQETIVNIPAHDKIPPPAISTNLFHTPENPIITQFISNFSEKNLDFENMEPQDLEQALFKLKI